MDNDRLTLSKQYLYRWFHRKPVTPEQLEAFLAWLTEKPDHDPILTGQSFGAGKRKYTSHYSEVEAQEAANSFFAAAMESWREKYQQEYAALVEEELWTKFNSYYLTFLIKHNPASVACYAAQYTRKDGTEKQFEDDSPEADPERRSEKKDSERDFIPTGTSFLLEASWPWHMVRTIIQQVSDGMDAERAFELFLRIAEQNDLRLTERTRLDAFVRDCLRRSPGVSAKKLGLAFGLNPDKVRRLRVKKLADGTLAKESATAKERLEALIFELQQEAEKINAALLS